MKQYIGRRVGYSLLSLFLLSLTIFFFVRVTGDPAALLVEPGASAADIAAVHHQFGLDRPLWVQYAIFMSSLFHGDLGQSFYYRMPVMEIYLSRLPNSLILAVVGILLLLTAISLLLRTRQLHAAFWIDEGISVGIAHEHLTSIPHLLREDGSPPLYYMLLGLWVRVFGDGEAATHSLSLVFGLACIPL